MNKVEILFFMLCVLFFLACVIALLVFGFWFVRERKQFYQDYLARKYKGYSQGGFVKGYPSDDIKNVLASSGTIRVSKEVYEKYGADFLRRINSSPGDDIIVTNGKDS